MTRCNLCGNTTSSNTEITDKNLSPNFDHKLIACPTCFSFWSSGNDYELMKRIRSKLEPKNRRLMADMSEAMRKVKEAQDNNE